MIQISREKSPFSDEREEIIFAERGNLLEESNPRSTPPIDSILIVFHAFERAPSRKIELYELATLLRACIRVTIRLHVIE